jgi:excisionase family DNA binding protein
MVFERRYLSIKECSAYLSVHIQTVYAWLGWLPVVRIGKNGRTIRIDKRKLDEALESQISEQKRKAR